MGHNNAKIAFPASNRRGAKSMTTGSLWFELRNAVFRKDFSIRAADLLALHPELVTLRNSIGETVLHFLAVENDREGVQWLFSRGFSLNTGSDFCDPAIFEVASLGYQELLLWLLEHGADPLAVNRDGQNILEYLYERFPIDRNEENTCAKMTALLLQTVPAIRNLDTPRPESEDEI